MKIYSVKLRQDNMLCRKCLFNVVKAISHVGGVKEFDVNLEKKSIEIAYDNEEISREILQDIINEAIIKGTANKTLYP